MKHTTKPFHRSLAIVAALGAALSITSLQHRQIALAAVPEYKSRGKGKARGPIKSWFSLNTTASRSKYTPHQGKSEATRRLEQRYAGMLA